MKAKVKTYEVNREKAVEMAVLVNGVSKEVAQRYTDSELKEVLRVLNSIKTVVSVFKANF